MPVLECDFNNYCHPHGSSWWNRHATYCHRCSSDKIYHCARDYDNRDVFREGCAIEKLCPAGKIMCHVYYCKSNQNCLYVRRWIFVMWTTQELWKKDYCKSMALTFNIENWVPLKSVLGGMRDVALFIISYEQTQSKRACNFHFFILVWLLTRDWLFYTRFFVYFLCSCLLLIQ